MSCAGETGLLNAKVGRKAIMYDVLFPNEWIYSDCDSVLGDLWSSIYYRVVSALDQILESTQSTDVYRNGTTGPQQCLGL